MNAIPIRPSSQTPLLPNHEGQVKNQREQQEIMEGKQIRVKETGQRSLGVIKNITRVPDSYKDPHILASCTAQIHTCLEHMQEGPGQSPVKLNIPHLLPLLPQTSI